MKLFWKLPIQCKEKLNLETKIIGSMKLIVIKLRSKCSDNVNYTI